ncbi:hypothetical protein GJAV_G00184920 [Gymnothorax javanicus]|nr:hypothetical protein GJAV_G00184920 [Gymnothorax javanicus]
MAQLFLLSLLVFLFQQSSAQVVVSSSSNKPGPSPPVVPAQALPTATQSTVRLSPAASTPHRRKDGAPSDNAEKLAALAGDEGHKDSNGNFGDEQGEKEGIGHLKDEAALPEKGSQVQGNASLTDLENTEEMSQDLETLTFVSPSPVNPESTSITTTAPSLLLTASSVNGVDHPLLLSTGTTQFPLSDAAVTPAHKQNNATQQTTPFPSTSARSDRTRSLNSTVREEEVTSGLAAWRPDEKTRSSNLPVSTVAESLAATQATPGGKQINVQPQGQNRSATDPAIGTKALTTRTPPRVEQAVTSSPLPSSRSPDHQGTGNATANSTSKSENSDETSDRSAVKLQPAGDHTTTATAVTPSRTTINTSNQWTKTEQTTSPSPSPPRKTGERFGEGSVEKNLSVPLEHPPPLAPASTLAPSLREPCSPGQPTCVSPTVSNGTWLLWSDLHISCPMPGSCMYTARLFSSFCLRSGPCLDCCCLRGCVAPTVAAWVWLMPCCCCWESCGPFTSSRTLMAPEKSCPTPEWLPCITSHWPCSFGLRRPWR